MVNIGITGTGSYLPRTVISNDDIAGLEGVDTNSEWIIEHTTIRERRISSRDEPLPVMMAVAAQRAMDNARVSADEIDRIYVATNATDPLLVPHLSPRVQYLIGAKEIPCQDIHAGCTGAMYAVENLVRSIRDVANNTGKREKALLVAGDTLFNVVNARDRNSVPILADGAGAMVFEPIYDDDMGIRHMFCKADGSNGHLIHYQSGFDSPLAGTEPFRLENRGEVGYFEMVGRKVHEFVLKKSDKAIKELLEKSGLELSELAGSVIIPHQMNGRSLESFEERLSRKLGYEPRIFYKEGVVKYGNPSTASTLIGADELHRGGRLDIYDPVMLVAFGAGLTWGGFLTIWNKDQIKKPVEYDPGEQIGLVKAFNEKYQIWLGKLA